MCDLISSMTLLKPFRIRTAAGLTVAAALESGRCRFMREALSTRGREDQHHGHRNPTVHHLEIPR